MMFPWIQGNHAATGTTSPRASLGSLSRTSAAERMKILANSSISSNTSHVDSLRKKLQTTAWPTTTSGNSPTHSNNSSANSSLRCDAPPAGLVSLSARAQQSYRPAMPFMGEEDFEAPIPTASFSSSTVRTMIPADEYIGPGGGASIVDTPSVANGGSNSNNGSFSRSNPINQRQQQQQAKPVPPASSSPSSPKPRSSSPTKETTQKDASPSPKRENTQQAYTTMRGGKRTRGSIPWLPESAAAAAATTTDKKTPAQKERDRYLKSLK